MEPDGQTVSILLEFSIKIIFSVNSTVSSTLNFGGCLLKRREKKSQSPYLNVVLLTTVNVFNDIQSLSSKFSKDSDDKIIFQ